MSLLDRLLRGREQEQPGALTDWHRRFEDPNSRVWAISEPSDSGGDWRLFAPGGSFDGAGDFAGEPAARVRADGHAAPKPGAIGYHDILRWKLAWAAEVSGGRIDEGISGFARSSQTSGAPDHVTYVVVTR